MSAVSEAEGTAARKYPWQEDAWLLEHAESLDVGTAQADQVIPALAARGLFRIGVPTGAGGSGGDVVDAVEAIARVAQISLTAAFAFWGHRAFIEYLLQSSNQDLREHWLPSLLDGTRAGATGLSNAMKFLSGIESLQIEAVPRGNGWQLKGSMPWVTNLRREGYNVAAAVAFPGETPPAVVALASEHPGVYRSEDLGLLALRGSNTASIRVEAADIDAGHLIAENARVFLPRVRPAFLGLQCGLSIGLARAALDAVADQSRGKDAILAPRRAALWQDLAAATGELASGLRDGRFIAAAVSLFSLRIRLAGLVRDALDMELEASGGRAYLTEHNRNFARRWREGAFIPIVTPSLSQLRGELAKHQARQGDDAAR